MDLTSDDVQELLQAGFDADDRVEVEGGGGKFQATIVSPKFDGLSRVKRHQFVYRTVSAEIESGALHALAIQALTPEEATR